MNKNEKSFKKYILYDMTAIQLIIVSNFRFIIIQTFIREIQDSYWTFLYATERKSALSEHMKLQNSLIMLRNK